MTGRLTRAGLSLGLLLLLFAARSSAQVSTATILGSVTDKSGAVIPGAQVTATNTQTGFSRSAITDSTGAYSIRFLPVGTYKVEARAKGFQGFVQNGVVLDVERNARVDPALQVGEVSETIMVTSEAPQVNTLDPSLGRTVENTEILNLPLVNRDPYTLLDLTPGVELNTNNRTLGFPSQRTIINGSADAGIGSVNYYLDGGTNTSGLRDNGNVAPNPDAVQEFRVITNGYSAEFGRFAGGIVDVITKSGTNTVHGSLFEFLRNDKLNANPWRTANRPPLRRNQFGGSFGGPIRTNRTFYFGSYSGLRQRQTELRFGAIVPTDLERQGNFSASSKKPNPPILPQIDPAAQQILNQFVPRQANLSNPVQQKRPFDSDELTLKFDHALNAAHQLSGSYFLSQGSEAQPFVGSQTTAPNLPWSTQLFSWRQQNFNASDTWAVNANTINQFRLNYVRYFGGRTNTPAISLGDLGSRFQIQGPKALPQITISGFFTLSQAIAGPTAGSNLYGLRDVLGLTRGRHSVKLGGEASLEKFIHDTTLNNYGTFEFTGVNTGNALADFLLGRPSQIKQDTPTTKYDNGWFFGLFIQDDFRIHPHFTLNLGLRYDLQLPMTDPLDRLLTFVPGTKSVVVPSAPAGLLFPGDPGITRGIIPTRKKNFAPRVGFAWDPFGNGRTSVRANFGIYYGGISANEWNLTADRQPFAVRQTLPVVTSTLFDPYKDLGGSPFPYTFQPSSPRFLPSAEVGAIDRNFQWPYTYQTNFSLQRQLTNTLSVTAAYVGTLGRRLPFYQDINYPLPFGASGTVTPTPTNFDLRRPILPGVLGPIRMVKSMMNTSYNGLQITAEKRMSRKFSFKGFYTFSKSLEGARLQTDTPDGGAQDMNNLRAERARTDNDRRHSFVVSAIWDLNYFGKQNRLRHILNGWTLSTIISLKSGLPFNVTSGRDTNLDGVNNDRPNRIGDPRLDPHRPRSEAVNMWFNPAALKPSSGAGQDGNFGRNVLDAPGTRNVDVGLFRNFKLQERMELQFRVEMTNAFNLVNLNAPTGSLNSSLVGKITSARDMRQTQLGLRLTF